MTSTSFLCRDWTPPKQTPLRKWEFRLLGDQQQRQSLPLNYSNEQAVMRVE
jgi:hypothetical protein